MFVTFLGTYLLYGMKTEYDFLANSIMIPSETTSWALTAFYLVASVHRAWRIRNLETAILVITAIFCGIAHTPGVTALIPGSGFIGDWLTDTISKAGNRIFALTAGIAATAFLIRTLSGRTRGFE
jgi:hypothetical protein